jgi:(p)ppGpp synthase/HD superfamily hydrolase
MNFKHEKTKSLWYATMLHHSVRQTYNGRPYGVHLTWCAQTLLKFSKLVEESKRVTIFDAVCYHDSIEDCRLTYNDLKKLYGKEVAEIVYCCTNEKGRNRRERANNKFYNELRQNEDAVFVKVIDRIANMEYSKKMGSDMFGKYCKEYGFFKKKLYIEKYDAMFKYIEDVVMEGVQL